MAAYTEAPNESVFTVERGAWGDEKMNCFLLFLIPYLLHLLRGPCVPEEFGKSFSLERVFLGVLCILGSTGRKKKKGVGMATPARMSGFWNTPKGNPWQRGK